MRLRKLQGQGLIEVMMTLLLLAGCVIALLRFQSYLVYGNNLSNQETFATQLAMSRIESLRDYSQLTGTNSYANIASGSSTTTGANATYTVTWTVTSNANPAYKTIDVSVTWTDQRGTSQTKRLISIVSRVDPQYSSTIMAI